ncbi:hypothetical protein NL676_008993 [Syzygium grande]|nr:hypothetical protein NL676_008993 [Syzygium grande]
MDAKGIIEIPEPELQLTSFKRDDKKQSYREPQRAGIEDRGELTSEWGLCGGDRHERRASKVAVRFSDLRVHCSVRDC